jgi:hypothetical protein
MRRVTVQRIKPRAIRSVPLMALGSEIDRRFGEQFSMIMAHYGRLAEWPDSSTEGV